MPAKVLDIKSKQATDAPWPWTGGIDPAVYDTSPAWPRISIITPSYNQGHYLEITIRSVLQQHYPNLEYIIIDGDSTDQSVSIIKRYEEYLHYWVSEPDKGQSDALNKGSLHATGDIIAWINSDDYYEPGTLHKVALAYQQTGFDFYCGACSMVDQHDQPLQQLFTPIINYKTLIRYWRPHFCPPQPSMFFKRKILKELNYFDPTLRYSMDFDLWLKASRQHTFLVTPDSLSVYRVHNDSKTGSTGGLHKFVPEWRMLIHKSLEQQPWPIRISYYSQEQWHLLTTAMRKHLPPVTLRNKLARLVKNLRP